MSANRNSLKKLYNLLLNGIKELYALEKEINTKYQKRAKKDLDNIAQGAITEFYNSYKPNIYYRYDSLYEAYKVRVNSSVWEIDTDESYIKTDHHQDNNIIYENVFVSGYHGGSWGEGLKSSTPHWRIPTPIFSMWGDEAESSTSPLEIMQELYEQYMDEVRAEMQDEFDTRVEKILKPIRNQINILSN